MKLITDELKAQFPPLYAQDGLGDDAIVHAHFFTPGGSGDWFALEYDPKTNECFGLCCIFEDELGYFSVDELESIKCPPLGLPIERDMYWTPKTLGEVRVERSRSW